MIVEFDCFLIDEIISVGDARFHQKCHVELFEKRTDRAMVIVSHDVGYIRAHCERAAVLNAGKLTVFDGEAPKRVTVQVWDSMEKIQAWRADPAYIALRKIGDKYAKFHSYAVEGVQQ